MAAVSYEDPISAIFTSIGEFFGAVESLNQPITDWIEAKIPLERQRIIDRRMRRCKRQCKKFISGGVANGMMIKNQVDLDFSDLLPEQRTEMMQLLIFSLTQP